jgi:quinoprotein glucose dehydrogenase
VVLPNADIAPGFENVLLTLKNGSLVAGIVSSENGSEITLSPVDGSKKVTVKKSDIGERTRAPSPMPEGLGEVLGKRDLRNVVEYLSTLK